MKQKTIIKTFYVVLLAMLVDPALASYGYAAHVGCKSGSADITAAVAKSQAAAKMACDCCDMGCGQMSGGKATTNCVSVCTSCTNSHLHFPPMLYSSATVLQNHFAEHFSRHSYSPPRLEINGTIFHPPTIIS